MSFPTDDGTTLGDMLNKRRLAPTALNSEIRDGRCAAGNGRGSEYGVSSSLERALVTIGRDSALRNKFLRKRWQGTIERLWSRDETAFDN
jgi:hypothetical protein